MVHKLMRSFVSLLLTLAISHNVAEACCANEIADPVFGTFYYKSQASFKRLSASKLGTACLKEESMFFRGAARPPVYLYGHYADNGTEIWIVGLNYGTSLFIKRGYLCNVAPVVIALRDAQSTGFDQTGSPTITEEEAREVFSDLLVRFANAFGGKKAFFAWLDKYTEGARQRCEGKSIYVCEPTWSSLPNYLQVMLLDFRNQRADR